MNKPAISVVLGSYNQKDVLKRVLDGFQDQDTERSFELIVVDSSSTDGTKEMLTEYRASSFIFKPIIQKNCGKASARNRGVFEAESDYIIITDSDMIPDKAFISAHISAQEASEVPTCFEGVTLNMDFLHWPPQPDSVFPYISRDYRDHQKLGWYYFLTGNISFPKSLFEKMGGFSENFESYGWEDLELGYRLSKKQVPLFYLKKAVNYHYHVITKQEEIDRCFSKGKSARIFLAKHPKLKWFLGLNPVSRFLFKRIDRRGWLYLLMKRWFEKNKKGRKFQFSFWFLKEYEYLDGITSIDPH